MATAGKKSSLKTESKNSAYRAMNMQLRSVEGEERRKIISFSSEEPYDRWFGAEILSHEEGAVDLERLNEIGVLLFNHKRDYVVGKIIKAWVEEYRAYAEVEFDDDEEADKIFKKVDNETLKGVSVGYRVSAWESVMAGKTSSCGRFTGPCEIARKWAPFEISIVSVPADATVGVGRELEETDYERNLPLEVFERQVEINKNMI